MTVASGAGRGHVWVDGRIVAGRRARPDRVRSRLPARRRGLRDAPRTGGPADRAGRARRPDASAPPRVSRSRFPADLETRLAAAIDELLAVEGLAGPDGDASVRITVSRGPFFGRGLLPPDEHPAPTIVVQAWPVPPTPPAHLEVGLHLVPSSVRRDPENPLSALKTTSRADYVYARVEARTAGADDALFLTIDGYLSEATSANLFLVRARRARDPVPRLRDPARHDPRLDPALGAPPPASTSSRAC